MAGQIPFLFEAPPAPALPPPTPQVAAPAAPEPPAPAPARRGGRPSSKTRPAPTPIDELGEPADIAAEICGTLTEALDVMGRMERELAAGPGPVEPLPNDEDPWIVFLRLPDKDPQPPAVLHRARAQHAAEYEVSRALGISERRCFAVPFGAVLGGAAVPLESHPLRLPDPPAQDLGDMIKTTMERLIRRSDEDMDATKGAHAQLLGCTVPELDQLLADQRAEAAREKAKQRAEKPSRSAPKGAKVPPPTPGGPATGMRRLTSRQQELLALVAVEDQRVIYLPDDQVPDWAALKMCVESLGGTWRSGGKKKRGGWIFPDDVDVAEVIRLARARCPRAGAPAARRGGRRAAPASG